MSFHVEGKDIFIGRVASINDVCLADSSVSRRHAHIKLREEGYVVYDLKSLNGVVLNEARVSRAVLKDGDIIQLGEVFLEVSLKGETIEEELEEIEASEQTSAGGRDPELDRKTIRSVIAPIKKKKAEKTKPKKKR